MRIYNLIQIKDVFSPHYSEKLSVALSYKIYKLCNVIEQEEKFFNQKRQEIINDFAQRYENGQIVVNDKGFVQFEADKVEEAHKMLNDLSAVDVDVPNVKFKIDELSEIKLSVMDMAVLEPLIDE